MPTGYTATIQCGQAALQPYTGGPFAVTSPPTDGATVTCTITNKQLRSTVQVVKNWVGTPSSATIFVDRNGVGAVRRLEGRDRERRQHLLHLPDLDAGVRRRDRRAVGLRGHDPVRHGRRAGLHGRPVRGHLTGYRRRNHHLHDHQQAENLHGASGQGLGRRPLDDDDLRRPGRRGALRRRHRRDRDRRQRLLHVPDLDPGHGRRDTRPGRLRGHDPVRRGDRAAVHGRAIPGDFARRRWVNHHVHDHEHPAAFVGPRWSRNGLARQAPRRSSSTRPGRRPSTPRPSRRRAAPAPPSPTRSRRRVTVGEVVPVPAGYAATIQCGTGAPVAYAGGPFPVTSPATDGATITCTIVNTQQLSKIRVIKNWSGTPTSATIFVDQDGVAPFDASTVATADGRQHVLRPTRSPRRRSSARPPCLPGSRRRSSAGPALRWPISAARSRSRRRQPTATR